MSTSAVIFDLYGTLLRIGEPLIHRGIPRALGSGGRQWVAHVREHLLVEHLESRDAFVRRVCDALAPGFDDETEDLCRDLVDRELASIEPCPGVFSLLRFLRRRGYAVGAISNLTSVHKEPLERIGLSELFEATAFSCDEGVSKPDPGLFLGLCRRLGVEPGSTLMVGDSLCNDVQAARAVGMRALRVSPHGGPDTIATVAELGCLDIDADEGLEPLVRKGGKVRLGPTTFVLDAPVPLPDDEQGRYNIVARIGARPDGGGPATEVYWKRFLFPEAAYVEEFASELMAMAGLPACHATVLAGGEPCLVTTRAPGRKLGGEVDAGLAFELGRQCAVGYIFANADLRPRNAFVRRDEAGPVVTMLDLEHWFFNLALDLSGLDKPLNPATIDGLSADEVAARLRHRVLSARATRRAMRTFVEPDSPESELGRAFKDGWVTAYEGVQASADGICDRMAQRVYAEPYLIIGTRSYRRAMALLDVADIRRRIAEDAEAIFPGLAAFKKR